MKTFQEMLKDWDDGPLAPSLSDEERLWLLQSMQPGMPLNKVLKSAFDFAQHLRDYVAQQPLNTEAGIASARQYQLQREAALNFLKWVAQCAHPRQQKEMTDGPAIRFDQ